MNPCTVFYFFHLSFVSFDPNKLISPLPFIPFSHLSFFSTHPSHSPAFLPLSSELHSPAFPLPLNPAVHLHSTSLPPSMQPSSPSLPFDPSCSTASPSISSPLPPSFHPLCLDIVKQACCSGNNANQPQKANYQRAPIKAGPVPFNGLSLV